MSSSFARFSGLVVVYATIFFFGGLLTAVFFEFNLLRGGFCAGIESEAPWACGRSWLSASSGWVAAIAAVIAAIYAGSLVKVQIERTKDQIDKSIQANAIARLEYTSRGYSRLLAEENSSLELFALSDFKLILTEPPIAKKAQAIIALYENTIHKLETLNAAENKVLPIQILVLRHKLIDELKALHRFKYKEPTEFNENTLLVDRSVEESDWAADHQAIIDQVDRCIGAYSKYKAHIAELKAKFLAVQETAFEE
ncbi:hypothetical protein PsAD46_03339 [Pseudovibrio sp. Ad46]|uniref:hypothetical protein n=1 Tax=Pseudovibrio sp. Ad46 TaxID=989432 RepID=UPI0007B28FB2|nr:hypothetical protein [Pseudovibrio sp. Ad46]KZK85748.1 hypothetical protein PsAD46_03339 [Pseudovibrio sp. Ad46]